MTCDPPPRSLSTLGRQELYDLVWSVPATKIAADFGVSDVAVAKHCKKQEVPRPSRGYWAKKEVGKNPRKVSLPLTREDAFVKDAEKPVGKAMPLPKGVEKLHPLAAELLRAINVAKPDSQKRVRLHEGPLPEVIVSKALAERTAKAFHVMLEGVEPLGIAFRKGQGSYSGGHFRKGNDRLYLEIEERLVEKPPGTGRASLRYVGSRWENEIPSGRLLFSLKSERYGRQDAKRWSEDEKTPLEQLLAEIVTYIRKNYLEAQKRRTQEAIDRENQRVESERRHQEYLREEAIRRQKESEKKHSKSLESAKRNREKDLMKASEWWRMYRVTEEFIAECERRWLEEKAGELTPRQEEWLRWAHETVMALSPFETGYPEPENDGAFDPSTVPFGGPYPVVRKFPRPPTMPKIPAPVAAQPSYGAPSQPAPREPYPFWLKHPRR